MKICIKENEFNPSLLLQNWCNEERAVEMGYTIVEAPEDCSADDFDGIIFNSNKYNSRKQNALNKNNLEKELSTLLSWFEEYDNQVKQYERCQRLGIEFDKNIDELDNQARIKAQRITEIRNILRGDLNGN